MDRNRRHLSAFALTLLLSTGLVAQPLAGRLRGRVIDPLGEAISGVAVAAITDQGRVRVGITDNQGRYAIGDLSPGKYTIWAGGEGFALYENPGLKVAAGLDKALDIRLRPSSGSSSITALETAEVRTTAADVMLFSFDGTSPNNGQKQGVNGVGSHKPNFTASPLGINHSSRNGRPPNLDCSKSRERMRASSKA